MPTTDMLGRNLPDDGDPADLALLFARFSQSGTNVVAVTSRTKAEQVRTELNAAMGGAAGPIIVWRTDIKNLEIHPNTGAAGEGWEYLAGRQHGATVKLSTSTLRAGRDDVVYIGAFTRASAGWSVSADNMNVIVPSTGMYLFDISGAITGTAADLGRVYLQFKINDTTLKGRQGVTAEDTLHGQLMYPLNSGDRVKVEIFHQSGGDRDFSGEMNIAQINSPRW